MDFLNIIFLVFFSIFSSFVIIGYGSILNRIFFKKFDEVYEIGFVGLLGFLFLYFISLIIHFFININEIIVFLVLFIGFILFSYFYFKNKFLRKKIHYFVFLLILFLPLGIIADPSEDFFFYYIPYLEYLYKSKLIVGLVNLNDILAFSTNSLFDILVFFKIPFYFAQGYSLIILIFYLFFLNLLIDLIVKNKKNLFYIFILIFSLISFAKLRDFGTTSPPQFLLILLTCLIYLSYKKGFTEEIFLKITFLIFFAVILRFNSIIALPLIFILVTINFKKSLKYFFNNKLYLFSLSLIFTLFLLKNVLISGCFIYPAHKTCFNELSWSPNLEVTKMKYSKLVADSKGWTFYAKKNFEINEKFVWENLEKKDFKNYEKYAASYPWFWFKFWLLDNNYKKIINVFFLSIIIIFFFVVFSKNDHNKINEYESNNKFFLFSLFLSFIFWLILSPQIRYSGYFVFISIFSLLSYQIINLFKRNTYFYIKIFIIFLAIIYVEQKNFSRIFNEIKTNNFADFPFPNYPKMIKNTDYLISNVNDIFYNKRIKSNKLIFDNGKNYILMCGNTPFPCIPNGKEICLGEEKNILIYRFFSKNKENEKCYNFMIKNIFY